MRDEKIVIWHRPFFPLESVRTIEAHTRTKYVLSSENKHGAKIDLFYQERPDWAKGHGHLLGVTANNSNQALLINGRELDGSVINCIQGKLGMYYSSYHYDYVEVEGKFIDGGRSYTRASSSIDLSILIQDGQIIYMHGAVLVPMRDIENKYR